jgi:hypothetical protein
MEYESRIKAYRFVAYSTVSFSLVALLSVCLTLPMLRSYVHQVSTSMDRELTSCQVWILDMASRFSYKKNPYKSI